MKSWAKFFFGSFFSNKIAGGGEERGILNTILAILLALIIIWAGVYAGASAALPKMYEGGTQFQEFLYNAFNNSDGRNLYIKTENGKIVSGINGEPTDDVINTFLYETDASVYSKNGYNLLVDVRKTATNYNDFSIICKDGNGGEIPYATYRELSETDKKNYTATLHYGDESLKFTDELISSYCGYLSSCEGETLDSYNKLLVNGTVPAEKYNELYELYYKTYYADFSEVDSFGVAPTMRTYYMYQYMTVQPDGSIYKNFLIMLDDVFLAVWDTDKGVTMPISGYYDFNAELNAPSNEQIRSFFIGTFRANSGALALGYLANMLMPTVVVILAWLLVSIILFLIGRACKKYEFTATLGGLMSIIGSFVLFSSIPAFVLTFICSFFVSQSLYYTVAMSAFCVTYVVRSIIYTVYAFKKEPVHVEETEESEETAE